MSGNNVELHEDGTLMMGGKPVEFGIDWYVFGRTLGAMSDADRDELMASRGEEWHGDPDDGGEADGLEANTIRVDRYVADGSLAVLVTPKGNDDGDVSTVSECLASYGVKLGKYRYVENSDSTFTCAELERAGIVRNVGRIGGGRPGTGWRVMEFTEDYRPAVDAALAEVAY